MRFLAMALLCVSAAAAADSMYRWVDKDGHVHYSQTPPAATEAGAQKVDVSGAPPDPQGAQAAQSRVLEQQLANQQAQAQAEQQAEQQAKEKEQRQRYCDGLRERLQMYQQVGAVFSVDPQGNRQYMSDEEHLKAEQELQDAIAKQCSDR